MTKRKIVCAILMAIACFQTLNLPCVSAKNMITEINKLHQLSDDSFDVKYYGLRLRVEPKRKTISGSVVIRLQVVAVQFCGRQSNPGFASTGRCDYSRLYSQLLEGLICFG